MIFNCINGSEYRPMVSDRLCEKYKEWFVPCDSYKKNEPTIYEISLCAMDFDEIRKTPLDFYKKHRAVLSRMYDDNVILLISSPYEGRIRMEIDIISRFLKYIPTLNYNNVHFFSGSLNAKELHQKIYSNVKFLKDINVHSYNIFLDSTWNTNVNPFWKKPERHFLYLNRRLRPTRLSLYERLLKSGLLSNSFHSFKTKDDLNNSVIQTYPYIATNFTDTLDISLLVDVELDNISIDQNPAGIQCFLLSEYYGKSAFSLVSETFMNEEDVFLSEKVVNAMNHCHPFVLFSQNGCVEALRKMGYKTFDGVVNHTYDNSTSLVDKIKTVVSEVERLCNIPLNELEAIVEQHQGDLEHNKKQNNIPFFDKMPPTDFINWIQTR